MCLLASPAAQAAPRVLVLVEPREDPIAHRLEEELATLGLEAVLARPPAVAPPPHELLARASREQDTIAALRLLPARGVIEIWLADRVTGKVSVREITPEPGEPPEQIALHALELLRASLLELRLDTAPRGEVTPPAVVQALLPPVPARESRPAPPSPYALLLGPGVAWSAGGTSASYQAHLALRRLERQGVGPEAFVSIPVVPASVEAAQGKASLRPLLAGAGFRVSTATGALDASAGGGLGVARIAMEGQARPPFTSGTDATTSMLFYAAAGLHLNLASRFALGAETTVLVTAPEHTVAFAGNRVASWGRPALLTSLVVAMRFP